MPKKLDLSFLLIVFIFIIMYEDILIDYYMHMHTKKTFFHLNKVNKIWMRHI